MITLVTALPSEARPLAAHFSLAPILERPFRVFASDSLRLVISGVGCEAAAAAVGFAAGLHAPDSGDVWVNIGIAGHRDLARGSALLGGRVRRHGSTRSWYPSQLIATSLPVLDVVSYDEPVSDYPAAHCCDMEAAGFIAAADRVADGDLVQVCKIISDNAASGLQAINRAYVEQLLSARLADIEGLLDALRQVAREVRADDDPAALAEVLARWHFSHALELKLRRCVRRYRALQPGRSWPGDVPLDDCTSARAVVARLEAALVHLAPRLGP